MTRRLVCWHLVTLLLFLLVTLHYTKGKNVSTTSSFKDTDVVTAIDQFEAGNLMTNVSRPKHHNYTGSSPNTFLTPQMIHGFKPVYDSDPQFVTITTEASPLPFPPPPLPPQPPRTKPGFSLFKKKKKRPPPEPPLPPTSSVVPPTQSVEEGSGEGAQRIPIYTQFNSHHPYHYAPPPPVPPPSAFSRLTSMFRRGPPSQPPAWRHPQQPMPPSHFSPQGGNTLPQSPHPGQNTFPYSSPGGHAQGHQQQAPSFHMPTFANPPMSHPAYHPQKTAHRVSLNHYLQKISSMFSRSAHVPGYRPYAYPQTPAYPQYFPLNTFAPHGQLPGTQQTPVARRKKLRVKKPAAERRFDQQYLTGRPRATKESDSGKPDTMEVKLHTGIHTESRGMILNQRNKFFNNPGPVFVRLKRDVNSGYRMPGIFGMDGGKPFYLDKDPTTGDITFTPGQQKKLISSNEVETNGTSSDGGGRKKKPMPIIIHSYSTTKMQGQQRRPVNKQVPKKPTFYYGNRTSTLAPPRLPSFYPKVQSLNDFKNSMGIKSTTTSTTTPIPSTEPPTTTTTKPTTTTTTTTTTPPPPPTTTTEEYRLVTVRASQGGSPTYPPGYDPYLPFDLLQLQTKKPEVEIPARVQEIRPEEIPGSSFTPTGVVADDQDEDIIGSVEAVPLDYNSGPPPAEMVPPVNFNSVPPSDPPVVEQVPTSTPPPQKIPELPEETTATSIAASPIPWVPPENGIVPVENVTGPPEDYDYDYEPQMPPNQATPNGVPYPPYFNPYAPNPQGSANSFNSFGQPGSQPPWYYPPPGQPFYPPWGQYPNTPPMGFQPHQQHPGQQQLPHQQPPGQQQLPHQQPPGQQQLPHQQPPGQQQLPHQTMGTQQNPGPQLPHYPMGPGHQSPQQNPPSLLQPNGGLLPHQSIGPPHILQVPGQVPPSAQPPVQGPNFPPSIPNIPRPEVILSTTTTQGTTTVVTTTTPPTTTTTIKIETTTPEEVEVPADVNMEMYETSNESPVSLETPTGPGFNPIQLPNESHRTPPPPPPHHFRPPPNYRPPYGPPPPHHFNRYPPPLPPYGPPPPRQGFPFRAPPPVGELMKNRVPLPPVELQPNLFPRVTPSPGPTLPSFGPTHPRDPAVVVRMPEKLQPSDEIYSSPSPVQTTVTTTTTTEPTTVRTTTPTPSTTVETTTREVTTIKVEPPPPPVTTTRSTTTTTAPPPTTVRTEPPTVLTTTTTTTTTTPKPTTTSTTTTTTAPVRTAPPPKPKVTIPPQASWSTPPPPSPSTIISRIPPFPPSTSEPATSPSSSTTTSSEYETYYEDYPDEPTVMYNPYNNAQGQYYSSQPLPPPQTNPAPPKINTKPKVQQYYDPAANEREPIYAQRPSYVTSDLTEMSYNPQDSLAVESIKNGGKYEQPHWHQAIAPVTKPTTTTQRTTTTTTTTTPKPTTTTTTQPPTTTTTTPRPAPPSPIVKVSFKPSQVDNFFISAEQILSEPGSLSILKNDDEEEEEYEDELPTLPNILPQFRPNANVDPSERLPLFGEGEKTVAKGSGEGTKTKVPEGPVEIPQQSNEQYEDEVDDYRRNSTTDINNQEITGMLPPLPHPPHPPYPRPSTTASFLSNLFYGTKRGPPLPPHVMIGFGNETIRPWGHPPPPGHMAKFPPGQYPPPNTQFSQGPPPPQGQGLPPSVHFPGQGPPPPHNLPPQQAPPGFFQPPNGQKPPNQEPPPQTKFPPSQIQMQNPPPPNGGRPHLKHGPPPPQPGKVQQFQGPPPNGFYTQGSHPSPPHYQQHPPNTKFQDDNQLKRNGPRHPYPPPPPGFYRGPPPPITHQSPPPQSLPPQQPITAAPPSAAPIIPADLKSQLESAATSSEEVIYVTQEELEKLKANGQGDEFIEYSDEVEVPAVMGSSTSSPVKVPSPSDPPKQELVASESVSHQVVQLPSEKASRGVDAQLSQKQSAPPGPPPSHNPSQPTRMQPRYSQEHSYETVPQVPIQQHHPPYYATRPHQPPPHYETQSHPQVPPHRYHPEPSKINPSEPLDYDDLITGPVVDTGPRDIIVKSSFSHDGVTRQPEKPASSGWQGAVEKVALEDSIKFMLPGGGTKSSGSIQWGGFQPLN